MLVKDVRLDKLHKKAVRQQLSAKKLEQQTTLFEFEYLPPPPPPKNSPCERKVFKDEQKNFYVLGIPWGKHPLFFFKTRDTICPSFRFSGTNGLKAAVMALEMDPATFEGSFRSIALPFQAPK